MASGFIPKPTKQNVVHSLGALWCCVARTRQRGPSKRVIRISEWRTGATLTSDVGTYPFSCPRSMGLWNPPPRCRAGSPQRGAGTGLSIGVAVHSGAGMKLTCSYTSPCLHPPHLFLSSECPFLRHLHISNVLRICLIRTWPYSLLK